MIGNKFYIGGLKEDFRGNKLGIRLSAPKTGLVNHLEFPLALGVEGGPPTVETSVKVGLQADNGFGQPTDVFLSSSTLKILSEFGGGWRRIDVPAVEVTANKPYHIVLQKLTGDRALCLFGLIIKTKPDICVNHFVPASQKVDVWHALEKPDPLHGCWMAFPQGVAYLIKYNDGEYCGQPYTLGYLNSLGQHSSGEVVAVAQEFQGKAGKVSKIQLLIERSAADPSDSLYLSIFDITSNSYILNSMSILDPTWVAPKKYLAWTTCKFPEKTLTNHTYRFELRSPNSKVLMPDACWYIRSCTSPVPQALYRGGAKYSVDNGNSWIDSPPHSLPKTYGDFPFILS